MAVRVVTLDVTNTCIRVAKSVGYHYARVAKEYGGLTLDIGQVDKAFRAAYKQTYRTFPNFGCHHDITCKQWWQKVVVNTLTTVGVSDTVAMETIGERLYTDFTGPDHWEVFPDVHSSLQLLKEAGVTLGIISNFDERLRTILHHMDLVKYFDFILASYEVKHAKPGARIFHLALEKARINSNEAVHVGDNYDVDYTGARQVGMKSLLIVRNDTDQSKYIPKDTEIIGSLADVVRVVERT